AAIEMLIDGVGSARIAVSSPHEGRRGQWLAYGTVSVDELASRFAAEKAATGPTTRLRQRKNPRERLGRSEGRAESQFRRYHYSPLEGNDMHNYPPPTYRPRRSVLLGLLAAAGLLLLIPIIGCGAWLWLQWAALTSSNPWFVNTIRYTVFLLPVVF